MTENHVDLPIWNKSIFLRQDEKTARKTNSKVVLPWKKTLARAELVAWAGTVKLV
jgi:hypothetical protein